MAWTERRPGVVGRKDVWRGFYRDGAGRQRSQGRFATKRLAETWAQEQERAVRRGTHVDPNAGAITFGRYADLWRSTRQTTDRTQATQDERLDSLILPHWSSVRLDRITSEGVQAWIAMMTTKAGKPVSATRKRMAASLMVRVLDAAVNGYRIPRNPARLPSGKVVALPKAGKSKAHRYLSFEQLRRVADASEAHDWLFVMTCGTTGLRFGEASGLTVNQVDTLRGRLLIDRARVRRADGGSDEGPTKTGRDRTVTVAKSLREHLAEQIAGKSRGDFVFPAPNGGPMVYQRGAESFERAVKAAGEAVVTLQASLGVTQTGHFTNEVADTLCAYQADHDLAVTGTTDPATWAALGETTKSRGRRWTWRLKRLSRVSLRAGCADFPTATLHDLRHTAASLLIGSGATVKDVQGMLGHASAAMTLDVYAGLFPDSLDDLADRMDAGIRTAAHDLPTITGARVSSLPVAVSQ